MKRAIDVIFSALGLLLLMPLLVLIGMLILVFDGLPVFFRQDRVGYRGQRIRIWKFRTMVRNAEQLGKPLTISDDPRITRLGYWLRRSKMDELPQLFNVLVGEMSLVGPRPEVPQYVDQYTEEQRRVLDLVPGITDPASIRYFDEADLLVATANPERIYLTEIMPHKIAINLEYGRRRGVFSDAAVLLQTLLRLAS